MSKQIEAEKYVTVKMQPPLNLVFMIELGTEKQGEKIIWYSKVL